MACSIEIKDMTLNKTIKMIYLDIIILNTRANCAKKTMRERRRQVLIKMLYFQCLRAFHPCFYTGQTFTVQKTSSCAVQRTVVYFLPVKGAVTTTEGGKESGSKSDEHK